MSKRSGLEAYFRAVIVISESNTLNEFISEPVTSDSLGELDVSGHDGDSLGVDGAQVGVLEEGDEVGLSGFLEGKHG